MFIDLVTYRARVVTNYSRSTRLPRRKCLNYETFVLVCLYLSCGLHAIKIILILNLLKASSGLSLHSVGDFRSDDFSTCEQTEMSIYREENSCHRFVRSMIADLYTEQVIFIIMLFLIYLSGDIEKNPCPTSSSSEADSNDLSFENFKHQNLVTLLVLIFKV